MREHEIGGAEPSPTEGDPQFELLTTMLGYSSLLIAQNVGLFLFGLLAVFGELACLTTAVVVLPAVLLLVRRGTSPRLPALSWDEGTRAAERPTPASFAARDSSNRPLPVEPGE